MSTNATLLNVDVPDFGKVPVQVYHDPNRNTPIGVTHGPPGKNADGDDPRLDFRNNRIVRIDDTKTRTPQYAVRKQKIITLNQDQLDDLLAGRSAIGTSRDKVIILEELESITRERFSRVIKSDCPDPDLATNGKPQYTVLLDWEENTAETFPELVLRNPDRSITDLVSQENNFLVISSKDGPNSPPARPPAGGLLGPLNNQPSDFRPATEDDIAHYRQYSGQDNGPSVAVMDTGLKYNLLNPNEEDWPPYAYRDADGQERRFALAYQDQADTVCGDAMATNHLGYCALLSYREPDFIQAINPLTTTIVATPYSSTHVINSPFDDCRIFKDPQDKESLIDARHGTSVTAIIQQNGDDAPVVPVKVFDNIGFATLFDVLNGFNYVLHRCKTTNIRVVNASWVFGQNNPLIEKKIRQLLEAGVFVIAAAGNEGQTANRDLDAVPVYPACYSRDFPNVITVTSIRKTYFPSTLLSPKEDSVIEKALSGAIRFGLFNLIEGVDDVVGAILPTAGYVAVENYSKNYVNVGVVSTFGYFRSPFWKSPIIRGSSYACAFVAGFVIRQLRTRPDLVPLMASGSRADVAEVRQQLLDAMSGSDPDENLKNEYVNGGYYLDGYAVD